MAKKSELRERYAVSFGRSFLMMALAELARLDPPIDTPEGRLLLALSAAVEEYEKSPDEPAKPRRNAKRVGSMHGDKNR